MEAAAATSARPDGPAARTRTGDRDAFVSLYRPDFDGLFDFVLRSVRDRASAAVALSDALHRAWDIFREQGAPHDVRGWLFVIARDAVLARPRRRRGDVQEREGLVYTALEAERLSDPLLTFDRELIELVWDTATALSARTTPCSTFMCVASSVSASSLSSSSYRGTTSPGTCRVSVTGSTAPSD